MRWRLFQRYCFYAGKRSIGRTNGNQPKKRKGFKTVIFFVKNKKQQSRAAVVQA